MPLPDFQHNPPSMQPNRRTMRIIFVVAGNLRLTPIRTVLKLAYLVSLTCLCILVCINEAT
jgi:hypothetical protein